MNEINATCTTNATVNGDRQSSAEQYKIFECDPLTDDESAGFERSAGTFSEVPPFPFPAPLEVRVALAPTAATSLQCAAPEQTAQTIALPPEPVTGQSVSIDAMGKPLPLQMEYGFVAPCRFYAKSECRDGEKCRDSHLVSHGRQAVHVEIERLRCCSAGHFQLSNTDEKGNYVRTVRRHEFKFYLKAPVDTKLSDNESFDDTRLCDICTTYPASGDLVKPPTSQICEQPSEQLASIANFDCLAQRASDTHSQATYMYTQ